MKRGLSIFAIAPDGANDELHVAVEGPLALRAVRRFQRPRVDADVDAEAAVGQTRRNRVRHAEVVEAVPLLGVEPRRGLVDDREHETHPPPRRQRQERREGGAVRGNG